MLERLQLTNFQRHKRQRVRFGPHVTTIVGPNDAGKSAVMRAIQWLATGRVGSDYGMANTDLIHWDATELDIRLGVDGRTVRRCRGPRDNRYLLEDKVFAAVRNDVPEEVAALLNMGPINFQLQHDQYFWFSLTPGQISKELNAVVDLAAIDNAITQVNSRVRAAATMEEVCIKRHTDATARLGALAYVPAMAEAWSCVHDIALPTAEAARATQRAYAGTLATYTNAAARAADARVVAAAGAAVVALGTAAHDARNRVNALRRLVGTLQAAKPTPAPDITALEQLKNAAAAIRARQQGLANALANYEKADRVVAKNKEKLAAEKLKTPTKIIRCPTCLQPIL